MSALPAGSTFPTTEVAKLGGGTLTLGAPQGGHDWQLVVVYRGLHCPLCKKYLATLQSLEAEYNGLGVDVVAVTGDGAEKVQTFVDEVGLIIPVGHSLSVAQMETLGLYISDPRSLQIVDVSNAPFARPDLQSIANGIKFIRGNDYPIRGTHAA